MEGRGKESTTKHDVSSSSPDVLKRRLSGSLILCTGHVTFRNGAMNNEEETDSVVPADAIEATEDGGCYFLTSDKSLINT